MARFEVSVGEPFEVDAVEVEPIEVTERRAAIDAKRVHAKRQATITFLFLGAIAAASAIATVIGCLDGSFDELGYVWTGSSGWLFMVLKPYFKKD